MLVAMAAEVTQIAVVVTLQAQFRIAPVHRLITEDIALQLLIGVSW